MQDSKEIGIAMATTSTPDKRKMYTTYVVANYYPRGNYGDFIANVVPP
jgi:hypothetical protein